MVANMRAHERQPLSGTAVICWREGGDLVSAFGSCYDVSEGGMAVLCPQPFEFGTTLTVRSVSLSGTRRAAVRHCRAMGDGFLVGLEFAPRESVRAIQQMDELDLVINGINY